LFHNPVLKGRGFNRATTNPPHKKACHPERSAAESKDLLLPFEIFA
jgi:hypothetical protein